MSEGRTGHTATLLSEGTVLVAGGANDTGCLSSAEIFDPLANTFSDLVGMNDRRTAHTATRLPDGKVLIAGGLHCSTDGSTVPDSAELYDPKSASFVLTGAMNASRFGHTSTLLSNGKVLITGGGDSISGYPLASGELYDPSTGTFTLTGSMRVPRLGHSATPLPNGKVLIAGGYSPGCAGCIVLPDGTAELFDPATGLFTRTGDMPQPSGNHVATSLPSGLVLITGGDPCGLSGAGAGSECASGDGTNQAVLYDPAKGTFSVTSSMAYPRIAHSATVLSDGRVLITGGFGADPVTFDDVPTFAAEIYDPAAGTFSRTGSMAFARNGHIATLISNGRVLVTGGTGSGEAILFSTEIYK